MSSNVRKAVSLILLDDDDAFSESFRASASLQAEGWLPRIAREPEEALAALQESPANFIVARLKMKKSSGEIFLATVKREYPNALRFLLIDPSDMSNVQKGTGLAHRYLESTMSPERIVESIKWVFKTQLRIRRREVVDIVRQTDELHINTQPMQELLKTTDDPHCALEDLGPIVMKHPTVVAAILQVANTAYLGAGGRIESVEEAIQMLGMDFVRNLAITELAKKQLALSPSMQEIANRVLKHCVETSQCSLGLRQFGVNTKQAQTLSSISLMHDLGKLVLLANKEDDYAEIMGRSIENNRPLWRLEQAIYNCDHAAIGAFLFAMWGLPENIVRATAWHHEPLEFARPNELCFVTLLHFANCAAHVKHEMPFYYGDELVPEAAEIVGFPLDYIKLLD